VAGPLLVLGLPPSVGAGLLPEHDSAPLTELPATRVVPVLPLMLAGPLMVFPFLHPGASRRRRSHQRQPFCGRQPYGGHDPVAGRLADGATQEPELARGGRVAQFGANGRSHPGTPGHTGPRNT
jgi:hypothetical protein